MGRHERAAAGGRFRRGADEGVDARVGLGLVLAELHSRHEAHELVAAAGADDGAHGLWVRREQVRERGELDVARQGRRRRLAQQAADRVEVALLRVVEVEVDVLEALLLELLVELHARLLDAHLLLVGRRRLLFLRVALGGAFRGRHRDRLPR